MTENTNHDKLDVAYTLEIYTRRAVLWFSFLITPVFGGILLMKSLKKIGKPKEATKTFIISLSMTIALVFVLVWFDIENRAVQLVYNLLCSLYLTDVLYKKYIPDADAYPKKSILFPVILEVVIVLLLGVLAFWAQDQETYQDL